MLTFNSLLAGISTAAFVYGALTLADGARTVSYTLRKVGGIRFLRIGRHQFSYCRTRPAPVIAAERMALATKRAQSRDAARVDAIARRWVEEGR